MYYRGLPNNENPMSLLRSDNGDHAPQSCIHAGMRNPYSGRGGV